MSRLVLEPASSIANRTGDWRTQRPVYQDKWPPCGQACPATEDIQAYLALATAGHWEAAWRKLTERNPFPAVMGRVCYHPCEAACNRGRLDESVNIHGVERHLGDLALANGWRHLPVVKRRRGRPVAVVGAGPAGLACAYQLARHGYSVTVFDAAGEPGGTLRWGVPVYRLPKEVLAAEIDTVLALGVALRLNTRVGENISADTLRGEYGAVFLAVGRLLPRLPDEMRGHGVDAGLPFLRRVNRGERPALPRQVAVIGGGNTAIDVARCARRLGADVTLVCPQARHGGAHHGFPGEFMPATPAEVAEAELEGVKILTRIGVRRVVRNGQHLAGIETAQVDHMHDHQGHFSPVLFEGTEHFLPAGRVFVAVGQTSDWRGLETLAPDSAAGVFVGGDAAGRHRTAATAVGSGFQGAEAIMAFLEGRSPAHGLRSSEVPYAALHGQYYSPQPRREGGRLARDRRIQQFAEITAALAPGDAAHEAGRCLSCGVCFECDNCWHFCPDAAVLKLGEGEGYSVDYDYCKGCGICAQECPCGHIHMAPEPL